MNQVLQLKGKNYKIIMTNVLQKMEEKMKKWMKIWNISVENQNIYIESNGHSRNVKYT